ncbi:sensor histidine kinase [Novosphingobium malaysiense]|uniref:sensor histidine kinase n=1 Tax=Novosphingobium malaysiense TaxID=1348853 RepID=UPI0022B1293B|nr:PAS domain-containing protein [Novosphingobium malaysiense]
MASAIVNTMGEAVLVLEDDLRVALANTAFLRTFEVNAEQTEGESIFELGNGQWDIPELRELLPRLLQGEDPISDYRVEHEFDTIGRRIMLLNARKLQQEGKNRVLLAIRDETERLGSEGEILAGREFSDKLIDSIREGLIVLTPELKVVRVNLSFCEMFRIDSGDAVGCKIYDLGNGQWDIPELRQALEEILPQENSFDDYEVTHDFPVIGSRTMLLNARRLDHMNRILLAIRDDTSRVRNQEEQRLLIGEVQHRVKNILGNVQSLANATLRRSSTVEEFGMVFKDRLQSVARAQDLLMRGAKGVADLRKLLEFELKAHGWVPDGRLTIDGISVILSREQTQAVAMVLHELTTNAVKYGAFSHATGRLDVFWNVSKDYRLRLVWRESGVPLDGPPEKKGFGTGMIERSMSHSMGGESELEFTNDGVCCHIDFPLDPTIQGPA